jgi:hypothetical protein
LVKDYYEGMLFGRKETLHAVFEADARFQGVRDGEQVRRNLDEFAAMVAAPQPAASPEYALSIELVDISGSVGIVKVRDRFRERCYVDYLSLVRVDGAWRIVNKAFTAVG